MNSRGLTGELYRHLLEETEKIDGYHDVCGLERELNREPTNIFL
jgi:hypothetical protein